MRYQLITHLICLGMNNTEKNEVLPFRFIYATHVSPSQCRLEVFHSPAKTGAVADKDRLLHCTAYIVEYCTKLDRHSVRHSSNAVSQARWSLSVTQGRLIRTATCPASNSARVRPDSGTRGRFHVLELTFQCRHVSLACNRRRAPSGLSISQNLDVVYRYAKRHTTSGKR